MDKMRITEKNSPPGKTGFSKIITWIIIAAIALSTAVSPPAACAAAKAPAGTMEGFVIGIFGETVTIEDYDGDVHTFFTNMNTELSMDMETVYSLEEFKRGMEVYIEYRRDSITYMDGYSAESFGQIDPGSRVRSGQVIVADRDRLQVVDILGNESTYYTSPATIVTRGGKSIRPEEIGEGDRIKLYFDSYDTMSASRIQVQGSSVKLKGVYRGTISRSDRYDDSIGFENLQIMRNGKWEDADSAGMKLSPDGKVYIAGTQTSPSSIGYYRGRTAYLAVKDFFGRDSVEKMVIKDRFERLYSERIDQVSPYSSQLELSNKRNIGIGEGSIVVKGGRLVQGSSISKGQSAIVVADSSYRGESANVVMVAGEGNAPSELNANYIYSARLSQVIPYRVETDRLYVLQDHDWSSMDDMEFSYDEDTFIYDADKDEAIDVEKFSSGKYAPDDGDESHAYIYAQGDRIGMMSISEKMDSLGALRTTSARALAVSEESKTGWTIEAVDASDYSAKKEKWMPKKNSVNIIVEGALIIRGSERISPSEIAPGDSLYVVRDGAFAKVVYIRP